MRRRTRTQAVRFTARNACGSERSEPTHPFKLNERRRRRCVRTPKVCRRRMACDTPRRAEDERSESYGVSEAERRST